MAGERILVVEDEDHIVRLVQFFLEQEGYEVATASDGAQALSRLTGTPPDLVLLDWMLPHASGVEILEQIRADPSWNQVPVLMLTAKAAETDLVRAFDAGADDYVVKPFQLEELLARITRLIRSGRSTGSG